MSAIAFKSVRPFKRYVQEMTHVRSVSAVALLYDGVPAGKIIANWSDNDSGSVCTAQICIHGGPFADMPITKGSASGCGYCKFSAAVDEAINKVWPGNVERKSFSGAGDNAVEAFFKSYGYTYFSIL